MSIFDQVLASCQEQFSQAAEGSANRGGWQPPDKWQGNFVLTEIAERTGEKDGFSYLSMTPKFEILDDGEHKGRAFKRDIFLSSQPKEKPGPSFYELCALATCLSGSDCRDIRAAVEVIKASQGAVIHGKAAQWNRNGKSGTNIYYNKRVDAK